MFIQIKALVQEFDPSIVKADLGMTEEIKLYAKDMLIRGEEICSIHADPLSKKQSVIQFYDSSMLVVVEPFESLAEKVFNIELSYYYEPEEIAELEKIQGETDKKDTEEKEDKLIKE